MARTDLKKLYRTLLEARFGFIPAGEMSLQGIYKIVKERYPELCDDSYLCSMNCRNASARPYGQNPEWNHTVRAVLKKMREQGIVGPGSSRGMWSFGIPASGTAEASEHEVVEERVPEDSSEVARLKRELDELQSRPLTPDVLREIQRTLKTYERPSPITRYVKRTRGATCQLCGVLGFVKRNGKRYCEVHHLFHLSKNPPPKCLAPEYLVVVCATCHRRMHYADVGEPVRDGEGWLVRVDDTEYRFLTR